jgi:hypothetical protein
MLLTRIVQTVMVLTAVWGLWTAWKLEADRRFADVDALARNRSARGPAAG